jgi:hypothetical protein
MIDHGEKLYYASLEARAASRSGWPDADRDAAEKADFEGRFLDFLTSNRDKLLGLAQGQYESEGGRVFNKNNLWAELRGQYGLSEQCLRVFRITAIKKGLISGENKTAALALDLYFRDPVALQKNLEAARELKRLLEIIDQICVLTGDKQESLRLYNQDPAPRSEEKITRWVRRMVDAGLLGPEWLLGRNLGENLQKMFHPGKANKMIDPREENK